MMKVSTIRPSPPPMENSSAKLKGPRSVNPPTKAKNAYAPGTGYPSVPKRGGSANRGRGGGTSIVDVRPLAERVS